MPHPVIKDSGDALEKLKAILLTSEKERLAHLEGEVSDLYAQLADKERLLETLDPIIADLLYKKIMESKNTMAEALAPVMGSALRAQIAEAKDDIADALHPVIGSAVRKSVAEAMKNLMKAINERIDKIVNRGFRASNKLDRLTLLREALPFHLEQMFYIHRESGLLLSHASFNPQHSGNEDIISGMLTAIRAFSKSAFAAQEESLYEIQYENLNIFIEDGKYAYLACVVSGTPSAKFKQMVTDLEHKLHLRFYKELREFDGHTEGLETIHPVISKFITSVNEPLLQNAESLQKTSGGKPAILMMGFILLLIIAAFIFWGTGTSNKERQLSEIIQHYQAQPGSFFTSRQDDDRVILKGQLFQDDRNRLLRQIEALGFKINSEGLFVLPSNRRLQKTVQEAKRALNIQGPVSLLIDSAQIRLEGRVKSPAEQIALARLIARRSGLPLIWNHLKIASAPDSLTTGDLDKFMLEFNPGSATLTAGAYQKLDKLSGLLNNRPFEKIIIVGTADASGSMTVNRRIARQRANAVQLYLLKHAVPKEKTGIQTHIFKTRNAKLKTLRRVEFRIE